MKSAMKLASAVMLALVLMSTSASADIKIGIVVSASGPGSALGQPQMKTVAALPKEIAGQKVTYIVLDDESDPTKTSTKGPIIEQDVERISHRDSPDDLVRKGRDIERRVLARAVKCHIEDRVLMNGSKTIVFPE